MMHKPAISTAVPQRRYQYGDYSVVVLGEIESGDERAYEYILAVLVDGDPEPGIYLTAEPAGAGRGSCQLRLIMRDGEEVIGEWDDCRDLDDFVDHGLALMGRLLQIKEAEPMRLA